MTRKKMFFIASAAAITGVTAVLFVGCDQQDLIFPDDTGSAGGCGPWYASGAGGESDAGVESASYGVEEGEIFPCAVWTSTRLGGEDTRLNVGELYLDVKDGLDNRKAMVVMISGQSCPACSALVEGLLDHKAELDELAVMVGLNKGEPALDLVYNLDEAEDILINEEDWPADWYITNDVEDYYVGYQSFPWVGVIRLSDMMVMDLGNDKYSGGNVDDLVAAIAAF